MKDCAFNKDGKCVALKEKQCKGCHFYKTPEELAEGRQKATERIRTLSKSKQAYIKYKYYTRGNKDLG